MAAVPESEGVLEKKLESVQLNANTDSDTRPPTNLPSSSQTPSVAALLREKQGSIPLKTPIIDPIEGVVPPAPVALTQDQQSKYDALLETVKSWKEVPSTKDMAGPITDSEIMWLTRECLLRYLRATKWNTAEAAKRVLGTLTWRREYGVEGFTADYISPESETGKQFLLGYDIDARPCHYLNPGLQNTDASPRQNQHLVFMVERAIEMMLPGQETLALLINFKSSKSRTNTAPGIGQGREVLSILQTHYPERLGRALIINVPWIVWGFFKLITPFIDPLTEEKLKFNDDMRQHVPPQQLWKEFQGDLDFDYEHNTYWSALNKLCDERLNARKERWVQGGKVYGESEIYLKGGNVASVGQSVPLVVSEENAPVVPTVEAAESKIESEAAVPTAPVAKTIPAAAEIPNGSSK